MFPADGAPEAWMLSQAIDQDGLRRYDASLHEGWYRCRFVLMRMRVDRFGTGSVMERPAEEAPHIQPERFFYRGKQIRLEGRGGPIVDGGYMGGLDRANLERLATAALRQARAGSTSLQVQ